VTFSVTGASPSFLYNWEKHGALASASGGDIAMNTTTGRDRGPRRAGALATTLAAGAAITVLAAGCGGSAAPAASPPTYAQEIALVGCMRSHGVPNFPDPSASGGYSLSPNGSLTGAGGGSVDINSSQAQAAYGDCQHLIPGGPSLSQLEQDVQQEQQAQAQALPLELKYSQCMRSHGVPNFPSPGQPTASPGRSPININSPTFLAATSACQHLLPSGAHVTFRQSSSASVAPS
jgi:hypothetical protein